MKYIYLIVILIGFTYVSAQTIQGSIKKDPANGSCVIINAKPSVDVTSPPSNYLMTISIPDQGTNPTGLLSNTLPGMILDGGTPPPYVLSGRYYVDMNIVQDGAPPNLAWTGGMEYEIGKICFSGVNASEFVQLNDLTASGGGTNGFSFWYFEIQGPGDVTNYGAPFYDDGGTTSDATNGGDSNVQTTQTVALPIELYSFDVTKHNNSAVLEWNTSTEINSSHFIIERSNTNSNWDRIARVEATGNSSSVVEYRYLDNSFNTLSNETFYYRLRMVDHDGQYDYSYTRHINFNSEFGLRSELTLYPNPTTNYLILNITNTNDDQLRPSLFVYDINGKLVINQLINNQNDTKINVSLLLPGTYMAVVKTGNTEQLNKKFIVLK